MSAAKNPLATPILATTEALNRCHGSDLAERSSRQVPSRLPGIIKMDHQLHLSFFIICLGLLPTVRAQDFVTLYTFSPAVQDDDPTSSAYGAHTNSDGGFPRGGVISSGNTLYGTTYAGGSSGQGTVFSVNTDGTGFQSLYSFTFPDCSTFACINSDGTTPWAGLVLSGNTLYGTAAKGGSGGSGTVFALDIDGMGFTTLYSFSPGSGLAGVVTNSDGASPRGGVILLGNTLYGTTWSGGTSANGTVFKINTDGTGFTSVYSFTALDPNTGTNSDGAQPEAGLILSGNTLYGTTEGGGSAGGGTVFAINTDGTEFTTLHSFTGNDGDDSHAGLILSGSTLYGTTWAGGPSGYGTVFRINTDGTGFANLHSFTGGSSGGNPYAALVWSGNTLYGTTGLNGDTVFALKTDGTGFTILHDFSGGSDGSRPEASLILSSNTLYGTSSSTIFSISLPVSRPQLAIAAAGASLVLTWPTNATGFTLRSTTNLASPSVWTTNLSAPAVVNGQLTVTNPISGAQQFFRLAQ